MPSVRDTTAIEIAKSAMPFGCKAGMTSSSVTTTRRIVTIAEKLGAHAAVEKADVAELLDILPPLINREPARQTPLRGFRWHNPAVDPTRPTQ